LKDRVHTVLMGWSVVTLAAVLGAQAPSPTQPHFAAGATAITVDVVVRDRHGKPVTDLNKGDFELLEDGVRQDIGDMTMVGGGVGNRAVGPNFSSAKTNEAKVGGEPRETPSTLARPTFIALVFDRLSPEARALAYKGAQAYLTTDTGDDFAGVFVSDLSLTTIQGYTNDRVLIAKALRTAASRATSVFDKEARRKSDVPAGQSAAVVGDISPETPFVASAADAGRSQQVGSPGAPTSSPAAPNNLTIAQNIGDTTLGMWERMARDQQGHATTNALLAVIAGLGQLPGRKTVVFFAEALSLPDAVMPQFNAVIAAANRANVAVYSVDSQGLRVHSEDQTTGSQINAIGTLAMTETSTGDPGGSLQAMEGMEDVLRKDPRTSLSLLADQTGGFLINNTNDLAAGFKRIDLDRRFHYLLTYTPKNSDFNGEWRTIAVKVPSRDVQVRARSGYQAIRTPGAIPLLTYEGRAVADLERMPPPAQIPLRAGAFVFPQANGESRVAVLLSTTGRALTFEPTSTGYRTDFTLLARIRDAQGEVVRKASRPYRLTGAAADRDRAQGGDILFYRQPTLPPGSYMLDVAADDAIAKKGGVSHLALSVPVPAKGPDVSDLVIVARSQKLAPGELADDNVLAVGGMQLYPNLGEPLRKIVDRTLSFYFMLLPNGTTSTATLTLAQNGATLATLPISLDLPDAGGRIQQVGQIPLASIPPGAYELTLTVTAGSTTISRQASFLLIP
jgi:VWFA-related protein